MTYFCKCKSKSACACSVVCAVNLELLVYFLALPSNSGTLLERLNTTLFAAVVTEVVVHLFALSGLMILFGNAFLAVLMSSLLFVLLFHSNVAGVSVAASFWVAGYNFLICCVTGFLYLHYGFENAVVCHAVAHTIALAGR
jgi:uncharacterized membrane protein YphA (DoxX/SURF4 family)